MEKAIIGKKIGMTQIFDKEGKVIPVTVIEAGPCVVAQVKTVESDGYNAVQLGFGEVKESKINKPDAGHFKKAQVEPKKHLREFRVENVEDYKVGDSICADVFAEGDRVDVQGVSKGHGSMYHRRPGSMGSTSTPGRVHPGKKLPGHMGVVTSTVQDLLVVKVDLDKNIICVKGSVPGAKGTIIKVKQSVKA